MEITNVRDHRIRWRMLFASGVVAGLASAVVMLAIATVSYPVFTDGADGWTFLKVVSSAVLGDDAATPLAGFDALPVVVGLLLHLLIGACAGASYAGLVAMFDLEGWTPVALFGLLYGAMLFVWSTALIGVGLGGTAIEGLPLIVMFWGNMIFGLTSGILLATWADRADMDQVESERVTLFEGDVDRALTRRAIH
ncbi:MAG: hypothetical protein JWL76_2035 [Thermoleophilia bacterium]|nr:hypothetical protein [Thermoleophilia bacterium]